MFIEVMLTAILAGSPMSKTMEAAATLPQSQEQFRDCVKHRESRGNYRAVSKSGTYHGAYQFRNNDWVRGLSYMVAARLKEHGLSKDAARRIQKTLQSRSIKNWEPIYQDIGFAAALNAKGPWSGAGHWHHPGSCNALVKR